jgi:glycosidase
MKGLLPALCILLLLMQTMDAISQENAFHDPKDIFYVNPQVGLIRLRVSKNSVTQAVLVIGPQRVAMNIGHRDDNFDYYVANLNNFDSTLTYKFLLKDVEDSVLLPAQGGFHSRAPVLQIPNWAMGKIYYFINVDGFSNGDVSIDPALKRKWQEEPKNWLPYGGDFAGIIQNMVYIESLDPDIILLSPIFSAASNHKLDPVDYATIDPAYGDTIELKRLIEAIHRTKKKLVLSVVFSHTGYDFPAFRDIATNGASSRYADWYRIESMPTDSAGFRYEAWRSDPRFPLLNLRNKSLQNYLIGFVDYWTHFGFDGFYVGENEEIDTVFMNTLYSHVKSKYPNLLILSSDCRSQNIQNCDGFFNRKFTKAIVDYFINNTISTAVFDSTIHSMLFNRPPQVNFASLVSLHDYTRRIRSVANPGQLATMYAFILTFCGSPLLFYGDEIGMTACAPLNWGSFNWNVAGQDSILLKQIRDLIRIRRENTEILNRYFFTLYIDDVRKVYAYDRGGLIVILNSSPAQSFVELPAWDGVYTDVLSGDKYTAFSQKLKLSIDPISYRVLKRGT